MNSPTEDKLAYQLLAQSARYLHAAKVILDSSENTTLLRVPVLHLVAHGLEVLMKHVHASNGMHAGEIRRTFGHNLTDLWHNQANGELRTCAFVYADQALNRAKRSDKYTDDFSVESETLLNTYIKDLCYLHSTDSDYALRYVLPAGQTGPRPLLLVETFIPVKDEFLRRMSRA